ncbi:YdeI/OmpD-associated family protein [Polaribacter sp. Hel_I_88]|uniref:YdeI/OmpD-associated family protein n=1 Tax=Polaribacter sp. Hel_I_88 TaxID=1250006 RepID=UPI00047E4927|nr:YdeI/OmpD-associated family protein [Polaribacter sp. Hel_I_88]
MKSEKFKITHINLYNIFIPKEIYAPFADKNMSRVKVKIFCNDKILEFYAAVKRDKSSGDFKMMFSKAKQKELNLKLGDTFKMQLFEDTSKYGVDVPEELEEVFLTDYEAYTIFETLTKGKQRSIIYGIKRFKGSQNKIDKALVLCENLKRRNFEPIKMFKLE